MQWTAENCPNFDLESYDKDQAEMRGDMKEDKSEDWEEDWSEDWEKSGD